jgi:predicted metal-dependent HD superfamily phosphohydrolase
MPSLPGSIRGETLATMSHPLDELLSIVPVTDTARGELRARLAEPVRVYHGGDHVALLWERHLRHGAGLWYRREPWNTRIACAIAYHDAVYDPTRSDNEARSAALWREVGAGLDPSVIDWVAGTILATRRHLDARPEPGLSDEAWAARVWVLDLDLTPLGEFPEVFDANTAALRRESSHLSHEAWDRGRLAFLRGIAAAPRLFRTPVLHAAFEGPARANIAREIGEDPELPSGGTAGADAVEGRG